MKTPEFSIIIPAHNEEDVIARAIDSILRNTYQNFEIIAVNDGSTDKTKKIVQELMKKYRKIKLLNFKKGHSAAFARNRGAEVAKGKILVFLDADAYLNTTFLSRIFKKFRSADAFVTPCFPKSTSLLNKVLSGFVDTTYNYKLKNYQIFSRNTKVKPMFFCIKKNIFCKLGGYNEKIFYYEDEDLARRFYGSGYKSIFIKGAVQHFELPSTLLDFMRQCKWIGKGINTLNSSKRNKIKIMWFLKLIFLVSPLVFLWNLKFFLVMLIISLSVVYMGLMRRNRNLLISILALPFVYIKTFIVCFNILRFGNFNYKS